MLFEHPSVHAEFRRASLPEFLAFGYLSGAETFTKISTNSCQGTGWKCPSAVTFVLNSTGT